MVVGLDCGLSHRQEATSEARPRLLLVLGISQGMQGTKLGPWLFLVMINDININGVNLWKSVDDTSMAETVHKGQPSGIQVSVDELVRQAETDKFQLDETKCKELQISFSRSADSFDAVTINNKPIEPLSHNFKQS